jgi:putative nucleotidyltransferase with HDIG domain
MNVPVSAVSAPHPPPLAALLDDARDLPSLPEVAVKVSRLADDPNASAASIARVIATDQGLTARILRLANSALYGVARRVGTVQEAVVILGLGTIRNLTLAASIYPALGAAVPGYDLAKGELWRHSVAAALCAQELARRMPRAPRPGAGAAPSAAVSPDEAFVAGLLHDIGKTLLSARVRGYLVQVRERALADGVSFVDAERALLGFDHAAAGAALAERWKLPPALVDAIAHHHDPFRAAPDHAALACAAHVSEALCLTLGIGVGGDGLLFELDPAALDVLGLEGKLDALIAEMTDLLAAAGPAFDFGVG